MKKIKNSLKNFYDYFYSQMVFTLVLLCVFLLIFLIYITTSYFFGHSVIENNVINYRLDEFIPPKRFKNFFTDISVEQCKFIVDWEKIDSQKLHLNFDFNYEKNKNVFGYHQYINNRRYVIFVFKQYTSMITDYLHEQV